MCNIITVEPPHKGHLGTSPLYRDCPLFGGSKCIVNILGPLNLSYMDQVAPPWTK